MEEIQGGHCPCSNIQGGRPTTLPPPCRAPGGGGVVAEWVRASTSDRTFDGSSPTSVKTFLFGTLAIPFTPLCQCLSDETVKAVGPFYLVSMPGEVKDPTSPH